MNDHGEHSGRDARRDLAAPVGAGAATSTGGFGAVWWASGGVVPLVLAIGLLAAACSAGLEEGGEVGHTEQAVMAARTSDNPAAGYYHTCGRLADGTVKCWGSNYYGQLGNGANDNSSVPVTVVGLSGVTDLVSSSGEFTCALLSDETVKCWGRNTYGALGDGTTNHSNTPVTVSGLSGVKALAGGAYHMCALMSDTTVQCWGYGFYGQLGDGTQYGSRYTPAPVTGLSGVAALTAGSQFTCARMIDGTAKCWGYNNHGELGDGTTTQQLTPGPSVSGLAGLSALSAKSNHVCALLTTGAVKCWGMNFYGEVGDGTTTDRYAPVTVISSAVGAVVAGGQHSCAVLTDGTVKCWGFNQYGQVGDGTTTTRLTPTVVPGLAGVADITAGAFHSCTRNSDGTAKCWGYNTQGACGDGTTTERHSPVSVSGLTNLDEGGGGQCTPDCTGLSCGAPDGCGGACGAPTDNGCPCDDGDACTGGETYQSSVCQGGTPVNKCSLEGITCGGTDSCGNTCGDHCDASCPDVSDCSGFSCGANGSNSCGTVCTSSICDGGCDHCTDGQQNCDELDVDCGGALCGACGPCGTAGCYCESDAMCDDGNDCTDDWCKLNGPASGRNKCHFDPVADGTSCAGGQCTAGVCTGCTPNCTGLSCGASDGCGGTCGAPNDDGCACDDGNSCTSGETFSGGVCQGGTVEYRCSAESVTCGGTDSCGNTCGAANDDGCACDDGNSCTSGETYLSGVCQGGTTENRCSAESVTCGGTDSCGNTCGTTCDAGCPAQSDCSAFTCGASGNNSCGTACTSSMCDAGCDHCGDATQNCDETGVDCGGTGCAACPPATFECSTPAAGYWHSCAVHSDGTAWCWGSGSYGQLGYGGTDNQLTRIQVSGLSNVVSITTGESHSCALLSNRTVWCWGNGGNGRLGNDSTANQLTPVQVIGLSNVVSLSAGNDHTCAVLYDGTARCWGTGTSGQLGDGGTTNQLTPVEVSGLSNAVSISAGGYYSCAELSDGTAKCWGRGDNGQLGNGGTANQYTPVQVSGLSTVASLDAGNRHTCAVLSDGTARCWGFNLWGQLGNGDTAQQNAPVAVNGLTNVESISAGTDFTCAALTDGTGWCWGTDGQGQCGNGPLTYGLEIKQVSGLSNITGISAGGFHTCAVLSDGTARCWGHGGSGRLGNNNTTNQTSPVQVSSMSGLAICDGGTCSPDCTGLSCGAPDGCGGTCGSACDAGCPDLDDCSAFTCGASGNNTCGTACTSSICDAGCDHCYDGQQNCDETGVDCGGALCGACIPPGIEYPGQAQFDGSVTSVNMSYNHNMGFRFTANADGMATALGGYFGGNWPDPATKTVYLYEYPSGNVLASTPHTSAYSFSYTPITAVPITNGNTYVVSVWLGGSGGAYDDGKTNPSTYGNVTIDCAGTYITASTAMPTSCETSYYGMADLELDFTGGGGCTPDCTGLTCGALDPVCGQACGAPTDAGCAHRYVRIDITDTGFGGQGSFAEILVEADGEWMNPTGATAMDTSTGWPAGNIVDNDTSTFWLGYPNSSFPKWVELDMGGWYALTALDIWINDSTSFLPQMHDISTSYDGVNWVTVKTGAAINDGYTFEEIRWGGVCTPDCSDRSCGQSDGCGGTCGSVDDNSCPCDDGDTCTSDEFYWGGVCQGGAVENRCSAESMTCGGVDSCGNTCGSTCDAGCSGVSDCSAFTCGGSGTNSCGTQCTSSVCDGGCDHCSDGVQNCDETGVDCGGALCGACPPSCGTAGCYCEADAGCNDGDECTVDTCKLNGSPSSRNKCHFDPAPDGTPCTGGVCTGGVCTACTPDCGVTCGSPSDDGCSCDDGDACTIGDTYSGGVCAGSAGCNNNGSQDCGETGVDCGGPCGACATCGNGVVEPGEECDGSLCCSNCAFASNGSQCSTDCGSGTCSADGICIFSSFVPAGTTCTSPEPSCVTDGQCDGDGYCIGAGP